MLTSDGFAACLDAEAGEQNPVDCVPVAFECDAVKAATLRLQACRNPEEALQAIQEIVANLLGSEQMAVFEVNLASATLGSCWSFGLKDFHHQILSLISEPVIQHVIEGAIYVDTSRSANTAAPRQVPITACVPIRFERRTIAILMIFQLLPQKGSLQESDLALLKVVAQEAGPPLAAGAGAGVISSLLESGA